MSALGGAHMTVTVPQDAVHAPEDTHFFGAWNRARRLSPCHQGFVA